MRTFHGVCIGLGAWALLGWAPAEASESQAGCKLGKFVELAVTMQGPVPITKIGINGTEARFVVDSGAFFSTMSSASASELKLDSVYGSLGLGFSAAGGSVRVALATVKTLTIAGADLHNIPFLVGGSAVGGGAAGVIGQNVLHLTDVEYDLANGVVRMMRPVDCDKTVLAYWATASTPYSMIDIEHPRGLNYQAMATVHVNGIGVRAMFDTGAASSVLSLRAAARAGIKPNAPGVVPAGFAAGFGQGTVASYIAPFASFKVGDEEIKNAKLRIGDFGVKEVDMLLGADFFLSHRIYVANGQHKLYFTYNGGPVFDLKVHEAPAVTASTPPAQAATEAPAPPVQAASLALPPDEHDQDAAALSRRGDAAAARGDMAGAIAALNRACELAPQNPDYFLQRALVLQADKQPDLALADYDRAIQLKADNVPALVDRAWLLNARGDKTRAGADVDAASHLAPPESDLRLAMAEIYAAAEQLRKSEAQYDLWIRFHPVDNRYPSALTRRCRLRAIQGERLPEALADCNAAKFHATKSSPLFAEVMQARALVEFRLGDYAKSIADYDAALKITPGDAASWYGRGIDKVRLGKTDEGRADLAKAASLSKGIAEQFGRHGIQP